MNKKTPSLFVLTGLIISSIGFIWFFVQPNVARYIDRNTLSVSYVSGGVASGSRLACNNVIEMECPKCQSKMLFDKSSEIKPFTLCKPCANCGNVTFFVTPELIAEVENKNSRSWSEIFGIFCGGVSSFFLGFISSLAANRCAQSGAIGKGGKPISDKTPEF